MIIRSGELGDEFRVAWFSDCERFRYLLDIVWDPMLPMLTTIALNPSTATELVNDNTVTRGKTFARAWGYGAYRMLNAFAWRDTDRSALFKVSDPVGPENSVEFLRDHATEKTLACWGATITSKTWRHFYRGHEIADAIPGLMCFRRTRAGHPSHPLYLPSDIEPVPFCYE
jgi:hypothetical protein